MENTVAGLRSRSRSKTPFLRSSCDRDSCGGGEDHAHHKSGRKSPIKRSTPVKQLRETSRRSTTETISEENEHESPPAHRTRLSMKGDKRVQTSDYSSEESLDRLRPNRKEIYQNEVNSQYERVSTSAGSSRRYGTLEDVTLSPIHVSLSNLTSDRTARFGSPTYSGCSTDSSFAEQALADTSTLLEINPSSEHLPYRLYKMAGEYWNKYPKTDYTYSPLSKDRVELAPGQVAVPNMSRRSLSQFRAHGPLTSADEVDRLSAAAIATSSKTIRKRVTTVDSSDDEGYVRGNGGFVQQDRRWWITRLVVAMVTTITTSVSSAYRRVVGPSAPQRYPYTKWRPTATQGDKDFLPPDSFYITANSDVLNASLASRTAAALAAPFYWIYTFMKKVVTTTVTTVTETVTPNHVSEREKYEARGYKTTTVTKRRWWPWLLLLLLPIVGYGCYNYRDEILPQNESIVYTYKSPEILLDQSLSKRMSALENWALNVDSRLKYFDQKLTKLNNLEATIEQYSLKHMQNNLIQIFNMNDNSDAIALKLKDYFDKHYITKDQMQTMSQEIHERLINSWKPDLDEDKIRKLIQEYLAVFERRQMEIIVEKIREYVKEIETHHTHTGFDVEAVKRIVAGMLDVYDADKTGTVDYALESAGGQVISTKCTELYQIKTKQYSVLGLPVWWVYTSPRFALTPGAMPAECWAFQGFPGYLVIRTYAVIEVTGFSMEHMSRLLAADGKIESAPKNFSVYGLHGEQDPEPHLFGKYVYDSNGTAIQYFPVQHPKTTDIGGVEYPVAYDILELRIESNHGNPTYTCVYRFRVHGNPLSDTRRATRDSIKDSEG